MLLRTGGVTSGVENIVWARPFGEFSLSSGGRALLADGDAVVQGNYFVNTQDLNQGGGLIGQLSSGSDPSSCLNGVCPNGNTTNFLSIVNDGIAHIGKLNGSKTVFGSLSAAYIPTPGNPTGSTDFLVIEADRSDNSFAAVAFLLSSTSTFQTITAATLGTTLGGSTGSLTSGNVTDLFVYSYFCNGSTGSCAPFNSNRGQFALDNIVLDAVTVPEPSEGILALTGLALVGAVSRRRRNV